MYRVATSRYRITKKNGQQGGIKANINLTVGSHLTTGPYAWNKLSSPDRMLKNSQWQPFQMYGFYTQHHSMLTAQNEFIFDTAGADPRYTTMDYFTRP